MRSKFGQINLVHYSVENSDLDKDPNFIYSLTVIKLPIEYNLSSRPGALNRHYRGSVIGTVDKSNGRLVSESDLSIGSFKGKEIIVDIDEFDSIMTSRVYVVNKTEYNLQVYTSNKFKGNSNIDNYLNSLKILE